MKTLLIDSSNLIYRIWWVNKSKQLSESSDTYSIFMFLRSLRSYVKKYPCDRIVSVWDKKLVYPSTNFRKEQTEGEYKGNRDHSEVEDVYRHTDKIVKLLESLGVYNMYPGRMEGDDVIAWLSDKNDQSVVVSADQDMYQLVTANTKIYNPIKKIEINESNFEEQLAVSVNDYVLYKSMIGDKSDNIKGLPRVGKKTAVKMINKWPESKDKLSTDQITILENNIKLMDLRYGYDYYEDETVAYDRQYSEQVDISYNKKEFYNLCREYNLYSVVKDLAWSDPFSHGVEEAVASVIEALGLGNK
jgi:DNA polymerase-1|tara:strand:+ start:320 stop:1225 length:906 start_codon:yes stop_codon:yes gene_type:complete